MKLKQFNTWERYFNPKHPKHKYQVARHNWFMKKVHGERLLDVGCSGGLALYLAAKQNVNIKELVGVDICLDTVKLARERLSSFVDRKITIHLSEADKIPEPNNNFDCVICGETLEHVQDDWKVMQEICRVLKPSGTLLVSVPKDGHLSREHIRLYSEKSIAELITYAGFDIKEKSSDMKAAPKNYYILVRAIKK